MQKNPRCVARSKRARHAFMLLAAACIFLMPHTRADDEPARDLTELSLEQLSNVKVTIASKHEEKLSQTPAAITVITQEDIRRSGATSIPELLRLVPGMDVARINGSQWAVSARGFNDDFSNKLLVMIDGRTIYTPLFGGVFWDVQDTVIEDIERIEVIRGPGASLWGSNAVNGVINIITKNARDTQGTLAGTTVGTAEGTESLLRYGGKIGDNAWFRVFGKFIDHSDEEILGGGEGHDGMWMRHGGFRLDWEPTKSDAIMLQGDIYDGRVEEDYMTLNPQAPFTAMYTPSTFKVAGGDVIAHWEHTLEDGSKLTLQSYWDHTSREGMIFGDKQDIFDVDAQYQFALGDRQTVLWGGGYRLTSDNVHNSFDVSLNPTQRSMQLFSAFVQDEITLIEKRLVLTLGSKFERNDTTGFEIEPSGRLAWTPSDRQTVWAAVSRAVRTPSRAEEDIRLNQQPVFPANALGPGSPAAVTSTYGNPALVSEKLIAYELGYRVQPHDRVTLDISAFYNFYDDIRSVDSAQALLLLGESPPNVATRLGNAIKGETYGVEVAATWKPKDWWKLQGTYSFLDIQMHGKIKGGDEGSYIEGADPKNQFSLRSSFDLPHGFEFDLSLRYVDSLPAVQVPSYITLDARLAWHVTKNLEISIVGQNLLDSRHPEFKATTIPVAPGEIDRGVYGKITWRF